MVTSMVCVVTLVFLLIEQHQQINSLQTSLYEICTNALLEHLQGNPLDAEDSGVEDTAEGFFLIFKHFDFVKNFVWV